MDHPAIAFLRKLDASLEAKFNIETYTDVPKGGKKPRPDPLAQRFSDLSLDDVADRLPELTALNNKGAGVFVAVNGFDGQARRYPELDGGRRSPLPRLRADREPGHKARGGAVPRRIRRAG